MIPFLGQQLHCINSKSVENQMYCGFMNLILPDVDFIKVMGVRTNLLVMTMQKISNLVHQPQLKHV